jgi:hypothetical protein
MRRIASAFVPYNFRCPNFMCKAEYVAVNRDHAVPRPRCMECGTPFLAMEGGLHIHYEAAWPVTFVPPDAPYQGCHVPLFRKGQPK